MARTAEEDLNSLAVHDHVEFDRAPFQHRLKRRRHILARRVAEQPEGGWHRRESLLRTKVIAKLYGLTTVRRPQRADRKHALGRRCCWHLRRQQRRRRWRRRRRLSEGASLLAHHVPSGVCTGLDGLLHDSVWYCGQFGGFGPAAESSSYLSPCCRRLSRAPLPPASCSSSSSSSTAAPPSGGATIYCHLSLPGHRLRTPWSRRGLPMM